MRNALYGLVLGLVLMPIGLVPVDGRAADMPPAPGPEQRAYVAARLFADIQLHFAHWQEAGGLDLDEALRTYLAKAMAAPDRLGFDLETKAFLARLRNAATGFGDRRLQDAYPALPFTVRRIAQDWVVSASRVDAVRPGDVIAQVDGTPTENFYEAHARFIGGGSDEARRARLFAQPELFPAPLTLGLADGRLVAIDPATAAPAPIRETGGRWLKPDKIAYIAIPGFDDPAFESRAVELVKEFAAAATLVIDLRGNGGGTAPAALLAALMNRPYRGWSRATPLPVPGGGALGHPSLSWPAATTQPGTDAFGRQLILLIDGGCIAACEDFVMPFKDNGRAVLIGERTGGNAGGSFAEDLGDGMTAWIGDTRVSFPGGAPFDGVGIAPDVAVAPGISDLKTGLDPAIAKVLVQTAPGAQQDRRAP